MEAGGRLFLNLSSACPRVLHHEVPWAAGSSSFGSCQGPPGPGRLRAPAPHQTRQAQAKENLEVRRRLASCNGGPGGGYPCRSERGAPQLSLQLEELLSGADPALDSELLKHCTELNLPRSVDRLLAGTQPSLLEVRFLTYQRPSSPSSTTSTTSPLLTARALGLPFSSSATTVYFPGASFLGPTPPSSSASEELIGSSALDQPSLSSGASKG